jgi:serine/threonine protein kinase
VILKGMLAKDPILRPTAQELLDDPYFNRKVSNF